jgi:hypothetical protein
MLTSSHLDYTREMTVLVRSWTQLSHLGCSLLFQNLVSLLNSSWDPSWQCRVSCSKSHWLGTWRRALTWEYVIVHTRPSFYTGASVSEVWSSSISRSEGSWNWRLAEMPRITLTSTWSRQRLFPDSTNHESSDSEQICSQTLSNLTHTERNTLKRTQVRESRFKPPDARTTTDEHVSPDFEQVFHLGGNVWFGQLGGGHMLTWDLKRGGSMADV